MSHNARDKQGAIVQMENVGTGAKRNGTRVLRAQTHKTNVTSIVVDMQQGEENRQTAESMTGGLYLGIVNDWCDNHFRVRIKKSLRAAADVGASDGLGTRDTSRGYVLLDKG